MSETILPEQTLPDIPYLKFGEAVTLTNCDREPIHVPGHAQAHGVVAALDAAAKELTVLQVSANVAQFCGVSPESLLGRGADALFGSEQLAILSDTVSDGRLESNSLYLFTSPVCGQGPFHVTAHTSRGVLTVEMEPAGGAAEQPDAAWRPDPQTLLRQALSRLRSAATLNTYCRTVCETVQQLSGFDRVMVYQFHEDGHGEVIAEVIGEADTREPYLGLHYPETDIPKQARALYLLNAIRLMPDALYEPSPIVPALSPVTGRPLDMTHCTLRGYSPMYTEYLTNMGARASMSLAIVRNDALWGLIACHHQTPRWVSSDVRAACEFLGDVVSLQIADKKTQEDADYRERILDVHRRLVEGMARHGSVLAGLTEQAEGEPGVTALSLIEAGGCAVLSERECRLLGNTPSVQDVRLLIRWLNETRPLDEEVWATEALASVYPPADTFKDRSAGLLALRVTPGAAEGDWVLWYRSEAAQTVNWGGNPGKPFETGPLGDRLTPRKSFECWQEAVQGKSLPWKAVELEGARRLRSSVAQVLVRRAEELERLNTELARSNVELDAFAYVTSHDLKEPLRGINNYIRFLREDHGDLLNAEAEQKLDTVVRITHRMDNLLDSLLHFSLLGRQELALTETDLNLVLADVLETLRPRLQQLGAIVSLPRPLPTAVRCDVIQVGELFLNLITNAAKYSDRPAGEKSIEVGWSGTVAGPEFFVRDNGIGIPPKHHEIIFRIFKRLHARGEYEGGTGAGLTISQKIVERHGGRLRLQSAVGEGTTFFFTLAAETRE